MKTPATVTVHGREYAVSKPCGNPDHLSGHHVCLTCGGQFTNNIKAHVHKQEKPSHKMGWYCNDCDEYQENE